jgi:hypothetical protein
MGAVTGDLEIATWLLDAGVLDVRVRYAGAEELHEHVVEYLSTLGPGVGGNEEPTSLRGFLRP